MRPVVVRHRFHQDRNAVYGFNMFLRMDLIQQLFRIFPHSDSSVSLCRGDQLLPLIIGMNLSVSRAV